MTYFQKIDASRIDPNDIRCPSCQAKNPILIGHLRVPHCEVTSQHLVVRSLTAGDEPDSFDLERIECQECGNRCDVVDPEVFALSINNLTLQAECDQLRRLLSRHMPILPLNEDN